jgi:tetratricopeptide (TPR) repeat protein
MAPVAFLSACVFLCSSTWCIAQSKAAGSPSPAAGPAANGDRYKDEALVWEHFDTTVHMHADGTGDRIVHIVVRLQAEGAARQFSVLSVPYASAYETGSFDFIRVHKPDGTTVETPVADAMEMPAAVTREAPLYSDLKEKQLPVRSVAAGDVLDYQFRTERTKAEAPGQFWGAEHFLVEGGVVLSQTLTLEVPANKYVQVWDPHHPARPSAHDAVLTYHWDSSQLKPTPKPKDATGKTTAADAAQDDAKDEIKDSDEDADGRKLPSVGWTTFHNWAEVGDWYRGLSEGRSTPTPAIQARADQLTKNAKTPDEQLRALYAYVSKTRYIGIDFGVGRYQPHTADEVMDHEYGDCKDKDTLLESLARAKGFTTAPALIGVNIAPVADLPSPASFNHVITTVTLPGSAAPIWLDTTAEVAPYRVLVAPIRDEQALVIPDSAPASLQKTPADPPFPYHEQFEANGTLDKDGLLKSHMEMTLRSDNELAFRGMRERLAPAQWDQAMQYISGAMGFGGTVTNSNLKQDDSTAPLHLTYDYSRPSYADWEHMRILPLFPLLEITTIDKDKAPEHDIDQGALRTLEATTHLQLPEGYRADLPDAVHVKRDYATFDKTYRLDKNELIVERRVVILKKKVPKADWKDYYAYTKSIGMEDGENYISLFPSTPAPKPSTPVELKVDPKTGNKTGTVLLTPPGLPSSTASSAATAPATSAASLSEADLPDAMKEAARLETMRDWTGAKEKLLQIQKVRPDYPYLMSMLGYLAMQIGKTDEAVEDIKSELKNHPDANSPIVILLAGIYVNQKHDDAAVALLKSYSDRRDAGISNMLASIQTKLGDDAGALSTLQDAASAHPDERSLQTRIATTLNRMHRGAEAATAAKSAMDGSDDPGILNDAAYELALTKIDLPLAEKSSRHAVKLLETASAQITLQEVNTRAFQQTNLLVASWDTLGWILFLEGKPADAEPYIAAAWFHRQALDVGNHLAQVREALGKSSEALTLDELAISSATTADDKNAKAEVTANIDRLKKAGGKSIAKNDVQGLQEMRSFHLERPKDLKGSGTFRVQLGGPGVTDCEETSGDEALHALVPKLLQLKMPNVAPAGSPARLVRDAVVDCSALLNTCEFVLMPYSGLQMEGMK